VGIWVTGGFVEQLENVRAEPGLVCAPGEKCGSNACNDAGAVELLLNSVKVEAWVVKIHKIAKVGLVKLVFDDGTDAMNATWVRDA